MVETPSDPEEIERRSRECDEVAASHPFVRAEQEAQVEDVQTLKGQEELHQEFIDEFQKASVERVPRDLFDRLLAWGEADF